MTASPQTPAPPPLPYGYPPMPSHWSPPSQPRVRSAEPGTPYHRMARTTAHRWWRPVLGSLLVIGGGFAAMIVLIIATVIVGYATGRPGDADGIPIFGDIPETAFLLVSLALFIPFVLLGARWVQARPAGTVSSVVGRLRWRWLGLCLLVSVPTLALMVTGALGLFVLTGEPLDVGGSGWVGIGTFAVSMAILVALVPLQAAAEEYLCRGWLLQAVGAFMRTPWLPIGFQAVLFAAAHGWGTSWGFADLLVFGVVLGWVTVRTGGLEAAIALHVVNNLVALTLAAAFGELASDVTAADAPWQMSVVNSIVVVGFGVVVVWLARRRRIEETVPAAGL